MRKENEKKNQRFIRLFGQIFTYYIANGVEKFCPNAIPAQCKKLTIMGARKIVIFYMYVRVLKKSYNLLAFFPNLLGICITFEK